MADRIRTAGRVLFLNREVDSRTGTIQVRGEFPNPGNVLRPGQYARIRAITELRKNALLIPQQAVSELQGVYQVGVVGADNKVTIQTVKLGPLFGDMWVVDSGLQPGENVIVDGLQRVRTGVTVAPKPFNDTQANAGRWKIVMSKFFINRPNVAIVIAILTVISGMVAMAKLPVAQLPDIVPPQINVSATYTGADALTIEQSVATPLEQQMNGVDNMLYMMSTNANDGTMTLKVTYDVGTNVDIDQVNTQNRVSQASPNLPTSVNQYGVTVKKLMGLPLLVISLYSPTGQYAGQFLGNYATINVNDALLRVPGVGQVTNFGAADYAMRIWVKPDQLTKLGMTVTDLTNAVQQQSAVNPAGQIGAEPAPKGQQFTYAVRAPGRLINAEEFGNIIVRQNPDGSTVRLKDVSRIELGSLVYQQIGRFNAKPAVIVCVYQAPGSNALAVAKQVKAQMEELKTRFPDGLEYTIAMDTTLPITEGMKEIVTTLLEAIVLVIIVVFLFLQNWRATLIPLLAVPVSLIGTFAVFPMLGFSINTLSLFGLILAIGLVVDDAIVVVEAVEHHIEHGLSPKDATFKAMEEVTAPVIGIALILSSVFVPMAAMGGIKGLLNQQFAVTIAISVLISAFNALTLSPALSALLLRPRKKTRGPLGKFFDWFNRWFGKMTGGYVSWSGVAHSTLGLSPSYCCWEFLLSPLPWANSSPASFIPEEDQGYAFLQIQLPDAASLQRTDAVMRKMDDMLAHTHGVKSLQRNFRIQLAFQHLGLLHRLLLFAA